MIKKTCLDERWILAKSKAAKADPLLIEKAIFAFELLGELVQSGANLVFKGGTCLMLLIPELRRLSIDIDIITEDEESKLQKAFDDIASGGTFKRWDEDERVSRREIPKRHFRFYYLSPITERESYILLDTLKAYSPFPITIEKPIILPYFEVETEIKVKVPTINGLTGDKLTAFAPATIGIPYGTGKSMEIIKQLFDLGVLFEYITDLREVSESHRNVVKLEASYRGLTLPTEEFLNDSISTAFLLCQLDFRGGIEDDHTKELRDGIERIKSHIFDGRYSLLSAKEDASKVACLASMLKGKLLDVDMDELRKDRHVISMITNIVLSGECGILNKLKKISPESFYLWAISTKGKEMREGQHTLQEYV
jgi:hypothetical protein